MTSVVLHKIMTYQPKAIQLSLSQQILLCDSCCAFTSTPSQIIPDASSLLKSKVERALQLQLQLQILFWDLILVSDHRFALLTVTAGMAHSHL